MNKGSGKLPIKTKIAVWWIIIAGVSGAIFSLVLGSSAQGEMALLAVFWSFVVFIAALVYILPAIFLVLKRSWSWVSAFVILFIEVIVSLLGLLYLIDMISIFAVYFFINIIPFTLVIFDSRKYWTMVEYRTATKRTRTSADKVTSHPNGGL